MERFNEHDSIYKHALEFMNNFSKKRAGVSNVYVFTSVDKNGNVVDEKYGMNLMTNSGFSEIYKDGVEFSARNSSNDTVKLYVGTGVGEQPCRTTDTDLELIAFNGLPATNYDTSKAYNYPMYFSKGEHDGEGFITLISRFMVAYYDYNISNFPGEYSLTEYGIKHNNTLWTHSKIYDIQGDPASITKTSNEQLFITVYMCLSFYESVIMNGWAHNRFTVITQNNILYDRMGWNSTIKMYKRDNRLIDITTGGVSRTQDTTQQNGYTNSTIAPQVILHDNNSDSYDKNSKVSNAGYIDGFILKDDGMVIVEPQFMTPAENVELTNFISEDITKHSGFADKFGKNPDSGYSKNQYPQMTHFFDANAYLFDSKSGNWSCKLDIYNPDSKWYDETPMKTNAGLPIYYSNNNEIMTGYVYQNIRPDDRIIRITGGGVTIYATNKYWATAEDLNNQDPNKGWVWIRDYNNIPAVCQTARYWITATNVDSLQFVRESDCFQLLEKGTNSNGYAEYGGYTPQNACSPICDNYAYGWYKRGDIVYVPSRGRSYTVGSYDDHTMTYGRWMVAFTSAVNQITTVDMSDALSDIVVPQTTTVAFTGSVNMFSGTHRTESGTGIICVESLSTDEVAILDLRGSTLSITVQPWKHACCIWGTKKIAYISASSGDDNVYIYDVDNGVEGVPIQFPSGITDIPHLFGHTNYVWMTDGSSFGYVCDIRTPSVRNPEAFTGSGLYGTGLADVRYTCVDDVFIIYKYTECGKNDIPKAHYIKLTEPKYAVPLTGLNAPTSDDIGRRIDFVLRYVNKYTNQSSQTVGALMLLINRGWGNNSSSTPDGAESRVIDFGQFLYTGNEYSNVVGEDRYFCNHCLYGENIIYHSTIKIPIINVLPIKLTGKTDTVNAMQYIKNITGKSWLIGYTNTPSWGDSSSGSQKGIPPGIPLAITDRTGVITGWSW